MANKIESIEEIKKKYKDEWVLLEVIREDQKGIPIEVILLAHSKNRDDTYQAMKRHSKKYTYHFYNGEIPKEYAIAFNL